MNKVLRSSRLQILRYMGQFLMMIGVICLVPLVLLIFYPSEFKLSRCFLIPGFSSIIVGFIINIILRNVQKSKLRTNQDAILVVLIWILAVVVCSTPYILTGTYNFSQAIFESMSGFSTTGLTVVDVDTCSHLFLFYRSFTLVIGGIGLVLVFTSALSDTHGLRLYTAEGHSDRLMANLARSGRMILSIYLGYIVLGMIAFMICGMNAFDALNFSMASVSTGGFGTHSESIGYFNSIPIEVITIVLMVLGSTNFVIHTFLLTGKFKKALHHSETKVLIVSTVVIVSLLTWSLAIKPAWTFSSGFRVSIFQFFSAITGTGFQTVPSFDILPSNFIGLLIIAMIIGGGTGSTAGALKQYRVALVTKSIYWNIKEKCESKRVVSPHYIARYDKDILVSDRDIHDNNTFIIMYLLFFLIGSLIFASYGYTLQDSMFEFASALGTVGLSVGITGYDAPNVILWTAILGMFFGRLEIMVIFVAFSRGVKEVTN